MKKIITYGTYDLFHYGHLRLLQRAKALGDHLTVGLSTDEFNQIKGKKSHFSYTERKDILEAIRYVDLVIPETTWEQKVEDVISNEIDIFIMGNDWEGKFDFLKSYCNVIYLERTDNISSSQIRDLHRTISE